MQAGGPRPRGINGLEADWLASPVALYYVTPGLRSVLRWGWTDIDEVDTVKLRRMTATLCIYFLLDAEPVTMKLGRSSAARLLSFLPHVMPERDDTPAPPPPRPVARRTPRSVRRNQP